MPFPVPSLNDAAGQAAASFAARIPGADLSLRVSVLRVIANEAGALAKGEYDYLAGLVDRALLPDTAVAPYNDRWAAYVGLKRKSPAPAAGNVVFTGLSGLAIPLNLALQDGSGNAYTTQLAGVLASGTLTLPVLAAIGGAAGTQLAGATLTLVTGIAGVSATATVDASGLTGGLDAEADPPLDARVSARFANPPQGGKPADYVAWALAVPGVTRAWVYPLNRGPGTCDLTFVMDGRASIVPLSGDLAVVQAAIDAARPVTVDARVFAPTALPVAVTVAGLVPNTPTTQAAIAAALAEMIGLRAVPAGAFMPAGTTAGTVFTAWLAVAIGDAGGVTSFDLASPLADVTPAAGGIATLGALTFT